MNYGLPYRGSKSKIAEAVIEQLPAAGTFVDLLAGGCAMTHAAMLSGKYGRFLVNDVNPLIPQLFFNAIAGKYHDEQRWISREDFFRLKDSDPYVKVCWSFGNNGVEYIYGRPIEPYKKALHYAVVYDDWARMEELCPEVVDACKARLATLTNRKERRVQIGRAVVTRLKEIGDPELVKSNLLYNSCHRKTGGGDGLQSLQSLQSLESLERLERLQSLESLERLERLQSLESTLPITVTGLDYQDVELPDDAVVYCDPPYDTKTSKGCYGVDFDFDRFYDWLRHIGRPVYVSEYSMPWDFVRVWSRNVLALVCAIAPTERTEGLWVHRDWAEAATEHNLFSATELWQ